jgi:hypothetical protein
VTNLLSSVFLAIGLVAATASARHLAAAALFDDSRKLKGQVIVDVGELEELRCPIGGKYDCLTWPRNLYRFNHGQCMVVIGYYGSYSSDTALLAVDQAKTASLSVLPSGIGSRDVKQYSIKLYDCPDMY